MFAAENHYSTEADLQQLRLQEDENLFVLGLQELLKVRGEGESAETGECSVVDPNTLNLDPDPGVWSNLDPDPGLFYQFEREFFFFRFGGKRNYF